VSSLCLYILFVCGCIKILHHQKYYFRYGDLMPSTDAGRLFAIFFSFAGISIVGALLGYVELIKYETNDTTLANDVSVIQPLPEEKEKDVRSGP
jgi:hypothetical protein